MFKSDTIEQDKKFPNKPRVLQSSSNFRISNHTPLLLFLSLIDTFECVKKFGKENNNKNVKALTILINIYISVYKNTIVIDYSKLFNYIHDKNNGSLEQSIKSYCESLMGLETWTVMSTHCKSSGVYQISIM